jgi:flagellar basal body-associated protein FliL
MNQDQNAQNYNPQNNDFAGNFSGNNNTNINPQASYSAPSPVHFSPSTVNLNALSAKMQNNGNIQGTNVDFDPQQYNQSQFQPSDQFGGYNPYQNTGSNIDNLQNFAPQDNFDTGFNNQGYNANSDFDQTGIDQYKSATPQFNANDPYLMPSTNPENDDLDETETDGTQKPQRDTKKILMFGLIGLIVVLLVASLALYFLSQGNKAPANPAVSNSSTSKTSEKTTTSNTEPNPNAVDSGNKTGNPNTPAAQSIVNQGATAMTAEWLKTNFTKIKGALADDGICKLQNVCGPKVDPDKDGLNNIDEFIYGTNPSLPDSDNDGVSDKDELFVYYSDPKNPDTNDNTFSDGVEISNCYDPNINGQKLSKTRLNEISSNVNKPYVSGISIITQNTLKASGAKASELEKGYLTKCAITSPQETVTPKSTSMEKTNSRQPQS